MNYVMSLCHFPLFIKESAAPLLLRHTLEIVRSNMLHWLESHNCCSSRHDFNLISSEVVVSEPLVQRYSCSASKGGPLLVREGVGGPIIEVDVYTGFFCAEVYQNVTLVKGTN